MSVTLKARLDSLVIDSILKNSTKTGLACFVVLLTLMSESARAHHAFSVHYDPSQTIEVQGVVKNFQLRSPHTLLYLEVIQASGTIELWQVAANSLPQMRRSGFRKDTFQKGDVVTAYGFPGRVPDKPIMFASRFITANGTEMETLRADARGQGPAIRTTAIGFARLEGRWMSPRLGSGGRARGSGSPLPLTPAAVAAWENYDEDSSALLRCEPAPMPALLYAPYYVHNIKIKNQEVVFYHEVFDVTRTVSLNSAGPRPAEESGVYGLVNGRIEGITLVVESSGYPESEMGLAFASSAIGNGGDVPSSTAKTLIERYSVSDDGATLNIEYTVEDPVYLTEAYSNSLQYSRISADTETYSHDCESND